MIFYFFLRSLKPYLERVVRINEMSKKNTRVVRNFTLTSLEWDLVGLIGGGGEGLISSC